MAINFMMAMYTKKLFTAVKKKKEKKNEYDATIYKHKHIKNELEWCDSSQSL